MSTDAGLSVGYTNNSLRATAVTRMYNTGVPEKIISDITSHKSLKALRAYERTSTEQQKTAGEIINSGKLFTPETEKENCENSSGMIKFASFEPESATAIKEGTLISSLDQYLGSLSRLLSSF